MFFDVWISLIFGIMGYLMRKKPPLSILRGFYIQFRTHAPEIAGDDVDK